VSSLNSAIMRTRRAGLLEHGSRKRPAAAYHEPGACSKVVITLTICRETLRSNLNSGLTFLCERTDKLEDAS
jgi:hypothetical protein